MRTVTKAPQKVSFAYPLNQAFKRINLVSHVLDLFISLLFTFLHTFQCLANLSNSLVDFRTLFADCLLNLGCLLL